MENAAPLNGIIIVDKPTDFTSFDVCAKLRGMLKTKKIGHTGTLDPMATGVLTVMLGNATKALDLIPIHDKEYIAGFKLGLTTDTLDIWGEVRESRTPFVKEDEILSSLTRFTGEIEQIPPMYSAVKIDGKRLYDIARSGETVERPSRTVTVYSLELLSFCEETGEGELRCSCSKGTYIRTLIADMGELLSCGAVMTKLRRTNACGFGIENAFTLSELQKLKDEGSIYKAIIPTERLFDSLKKVGITAPQAVRYSNGGELSLDRLNRPPADFADGELVTVYGSPTGGERQFMGLSVVSREKGMLLVKKRFS
ncbi:MAG: tRNA pseudouridine(55) synthase TruB [Oscillospiraceae bacterium]|jgi:tRNA pseudouridine55 synthase|nr:tRNA pseudouridine(55) synthase TruB [Oscillospiraceae bacterium]